MLTLTTAIKKRKLLTLQEVVERLDEIKEAVFEGQSTPTRGGKIRQLLDSEAAADFLALWQARTAIIGIKEMLSDKILDGVTIDIEEIKRISN